MELGAYAGDEAFETAALIEAAARAAEVDLDPATDEAEDRPTASPISRTEGG